MMIKQQTLIKITWGVIIFCVVLLITWDVIDKILDPSGISTISWQMWLAACFRPIIGVAVGIVVGHLFWQTPSSPITRALKKLLKPLGER